MRDNNFVSIQTHEDLLQAIEDYNVPLEVALDVIHRILSWVENGGYMNDNYVKQQYRYVEKYITMRRKDI